MLMAGLENKHGLRFQQSIFIVERTVCLLFCDQCLFWCVKSDKTRNGRGSLPCLYNTCAIIIATTYHLSICLLMSYTEFTYLIRFSYFYDNISYNKTEKEFSILFRSRKLIFLTQLRGGCVQNINFYVTFAPRFDHYAFEIRLKIHKIIKLQLKI